MLRRFAWVAFAAIAIIAAIVIFDWLNGPSDQDQEDAIVELIRNTLPDQLSQLGGTTVTVGAIDCVDQGDNRYRCVAQVSDETATNLGVQLEASCDDENCEWHLTG